MSAADFLTQLDQLSDEALRAFEQVDSQEQLEAQRVRFLGAKQGLLKQVRNQLGQVPASDKPVAGQRFNQLKQAIEAALATAQQRIGASSQGGAVYRGEDPTLPGEPLELGHMHPIHQTIEHLKEIMGRLGFTPTEGPEVEDAWHNFDALNIPEDHPARDPLDNFYLDPASVGSGGGGPGWLLRSQTSTVQIRVMEQQSPPVRIISLGRVYRPDEADATHFPMFHQMEGLWVEAGVTMAQLKSILRMFATSYLGAEVPIRFRPSFFPFTEPSVEVDFFWRDQWMEFGGAGMVDPNVLAAVGYDPEQVSGLAFGLGVERLCMRRFGITDIRDLYRNDVRFLRQF